MTHTRVLIVADTTDTFADAVYRLALDVETAYRAPTVADAIERAAGWATQGIASTTLDTTGTLLATQPAGPVIEVSKRTRVVPLGYQARGERAGHAKLTDAKVRAIRERWGTGTVTGPQLAREYGVSVTAISAVVTGKSWRHVEATEEDSTRGETSQSPNPTYAAAAMARP